MTNVDRDALQHIIKEMDDLLSLRQGFVSAYREWRTTAAERVSEAAGEQCGAQFEKQGPRNTPINRQHRVHNYRQTLVAQIRYLNEVLGQPSD